MNTDAPTFHSDWYTSSIPYLFCPEEAWSGKMLRDNHKRTYSLVWQSLMGHAR